MEHDGTLNPGTHGHMSICQPGRHRTAGRRRWQHHAYGCPAVPSSNRCAKTRGCRHPPTPR